MKLAKIVAEKKQEIVDVRKGASLEEAASLMCSRKIGVVLVYEDGKDMKRYVGIVSDSDVISALCRHGGISGVKVSDVMTTRMIVATSEDPLDYAMNVMMRHKISHLPVIEGKRIAAVVSIRDLIKELYDEDEIKIRYYGDYIGGTYKSEGF